VPLVDLDRWGESAYAYGVPREASDAVRIPAEAGQGLSLKSAKDEPGWMTVCKVVSVGGGVLIMA
jgi:hypothetical protein